MKQKEVLFLKPVFRENIWGGDRLAFDFCYEIPGVHTGECLAAGVFPGCEIRIDRGTYEGYSLDRLWKEQRELFGNYPSEDFPLSVKLLDAQEDLSVQVHPDSRYAKEQENGAEGRTKFWYVIDCEEDAQIILGHTAKDKAEFKKKMKERKFSDLFQKVSVKKGDVFQINPGCVHALLKGNCIYEVNAGSDIAYRIYDYDRIRDGKKAELHTAQAAEVTQFPYVKFKLDPKVTTYENGTVTEYVDGFSYRILCVDLEGGSLEMPLEGEFALATVIDGCGEISGTKIRKGNHFIITSRYKTFTFIGRLQVMLCYPKSSHF